jgi:MFS family permease
MAYAGMVIGYVPLLTLILPIRLTEMTAPGDEVRWLALCAMGGALAASIGNIFGGWVSDRTRDGRMGRRSWAAIGLAGFVGSLVLVEISRRPLDMLAAIVVFQFALNMMLSPISAAFAEETPDERRGLLGGVLGFVYPAGPLLGVLATLPPVRALGVELLVVGATTFLLVLPFLITPSTGPRAVFEDDDSRRKLADFGRAGAARLLLQIAGGILFAFLLYYAAGLPDAPSFKGDLASSTAGVVAVVTLLSAPLSLAIGWTTQRFGGWRFWLALAAGACALGLVVMAFASGRSLAMTGYAVFGCALAVFLALHTAYAMRLLPSSRRCGFDLGVMNLTNTVPSIIGPGLTWFVLSVADYRTLLLLLGLFSLASVALMLSIRTRSSHTA